MSKKSLVSHSIFYLCFPFLLFCIGFLHWYWAVIVGIVSICSCGSIVRLYGAEVEARRISLTQIMVCVVVAIFCCFILGIGGYWSQSYDWLVKNPLLNELTQSDWPLVIDFSNANAAVKDLCGDGKVGFVYYLFYYLPAAWVGKLFGSYVVSRLGLFVWSVYGLTLIYCWLALYVSWSVSLTRRKVLFLLLLFVCWGGLDIIGQILRILYLWLNGYSEILPTSLIDEWCSPYFTYYPSHFTSLYWCFNQCIPLWLISMIIFVERDWRSVGFFYCFSILYSPWGAMGLTSILLIWGIAELVDRGWTLLGEFLNFSNVVFPLLVALIAGSYYMSNKTPLQETGFFWNYVGIGVFVGKYVLFILLELGVYLWLSRKEICHDKVLLAAIITLHLIPFYKMTAPNDFLMRASIPPLFFLFIWWVKWSIDHFKENKRVVMLITVLSSLSALQLIHNTTKYTIINHGPIVQAQNYLFSDNDNAFIAKFGKEQFYAYDYEDTFFWKYLAK